MENQILSLCLLRRTNVLNHDEFRDRLVAMCYKFDDLENIAIDVESLHDRAEENGT